MGTEIQTSVNSRLANALFTPVQQQVLGLLFGQPNRQFQSSELIKLVGAGTGATHRVLQRLADPGLLTVKVLGRQKYYQANPNSPIFNELVSLVQKTSGITIPLQNALDDLDEDIVAAFVYGSVAKGTDHAGSDLDLMVVGDELGYPKLFEALERAELTLDRPINPTLMSLDKWHEKRSITDSFVSRVFDLPCIFVIGSQDDLR